MGITDAVDLKSKRGCKFGFWNSEFEKRKGVSEGERALVEGGGREGVGYQGSGEGRRETGDGGREAGIGRRESGEGGRGLLETPKDGWLTSV